MYYKEMLSDEILKSIKRIMRSNILEDYEKCVIIKSFINNLIDSKDPIGVMFAFMCCKAIM